MVMNGTLAFVLLLGGVIVLSVHLFKSATCWRDDDYLAGNDPLYAHMLFTIIVLPFVVEFLIFAAPSPIRQANELVIVLALIGWTTLYPFFFEWLMRRYGRMNGIIILYYVPVGIFVLWRLYEIVMVRENFWVLLFPLVLAVWKASNIISARSPHEVQQEIRNQQREYLENNDEEHPLTDDPASVFEKPSRE